MLIRLRYLLLGLCLFSFPIQASEPTLEELSQLSLEELMSLELTVTSAAKKPQKLAEAASAISVLTHEGIRASGARTLADILRLLPGVQVARINAHNWAVSVRGFNSQLSAKLQVLIDGRSIYSHLAASVIWNRHHPILDDIERIEVIRGSGASLWGANAMNGVINIITRHSKKSQGNRLIAGGGNEEKMFASFIHGGEINKDSYYKLYAKGYERDQGGLMNGEESNDLSRGFQSGFRIDSQLTMFDELTVQGDYFEGVEEENLDTSLLSKQTIDLKTQNYNVLTRWKYQATEGDKLALQLYFNREQVDTVGGDHVWTDYLIDTYDVDLQHRFKILENQELIWGLGYRLVVDSYREGLIFDYADKHRKIPLYSGFIQNEVSLIPDFWRLIIGSKFEHNDYTGFEFQPTVRSILNWEDHALWAAYSRSTRTPSRGANSLIYKASGPGGALVNYVGVRSKLKSEVLNSFEIGYRFKANERLNFDLAAYYNSYDYLVELNQPIYTSALITLDASYKGDATIMGFEAEVDWRPIDALAVKLSYSYLDDKSTVEYVSRNVESAPHHQAVFFTQYRFSQQWDFSFTTRYVDRIDYYQIDSYLALDGRIAFNPTQGLEFSVVGQNLLDNQHPEFSEKALDTTPTEVERSVFAQLKWEF